MRTSATSTIYMKVRVTSPLSGEFQLGSIADDVFKMSKGQANYSNWTKLVREYRDRIYMRKDVLLKLYQYGELNQTKLMSFCGLNSVKHRGILEDMVGKGLITRRQEHWGDTIVLMYKASEKGMKILRELLEPYEELFPRGSEHGKNGAVSDGSRI